MSGCDPTLPPATRREPLSPDEQEHEEVVMGQPAAPFLLASLVMGAVLRRLVLRRDSCSQRDYRVFFSPFLFPFS